VTPDSSAIVAAFAPWHPLHRTARRKLRGIDDLVAHAELETYSVLTRLPAPFRVEGELAAYYLRRRHPGARLVLPAAGRVRLVTRLAMGAVSGGMVYDALIAATAADHGLTLLTCDRRAVPVYERLQAPFELIDAGNAAPPPG